MLRVGRRSRAAEHAAALRRSARGRARVAGAVAAGAIALAAGPAAAHPLAPSLLSVEESADGAIAVSFKMARQQPTGAEIAPELPERCVPAERPRVETDEQSVTVRWTAHCGAEGIVGARFGVLGLAETGTNALLRVALRDGRRVQAVLHARAPSLVVPERVSALGAFRDYLRLGALHIATGFDHLLFVFGLVLLASSMSRLLWTVTAFTAGHSVTLSLAALGVVRFPSAPIEVAIAVTILVLALELRAQEKVRRANRRCAAAPGRSRSPSVSCTGSASRARWPRSACRRRRSPWRCSPSTSGSSSASSPSSRSCSRCAGH